MRRFGVIFFIILTFFPIGVSIADQDIQERSIVVSGQDNVSSPPEFPQPMHFGRILATESEASVPVSPGELEFQVSVNMSFAIVDKY